MLDQDFWDERWRNQQTGWDMGCAQMGLVEYIAKHFDTHVHILIPGCGNAHEALALWVKGYKNITLIDIAPTLIKQLEPKIKHTQIQLIHGDFFEHHGQYDLIIEQTFFCALDPVLRSNYVDHMAHLLENKNGRLVGLMFNVEMPEGPPFGGNTSSYLKLFEKRFKCQFTPCDFSIAPRMGKEVLIDAELL